jgi:hypothetical protein
MPELGDDTQATADDSTMPELKDETAPEDGAGDGAGREQQEGKKDDNFGTQVLVGEIKEHDPDEDNSRLFE